MSQSEGPGFDATAKVDGYQLAFTIAGGCVVTGILVAAVVLRTPRPPEPELASEPD